MTTAISMTEGYEAYDRIDLSSVLDEQSFQRTGMVSDAEIHKIGEMTGASYVLITESAPMDESYIVATAKIVNVESAKIENSANSVMSVNPTQMKAACRELTDELLNISSTQTETKNEKKGTLEAGHEFVDLGLSVKWATCNVGAEKPEEYGDYFAWGEIKTKSSYTWTNYRFRISGDSYDDVKLSRYTTGYNGTVDGKITLDMADDVAHIQWGGSWRMPTKAELDELKEYCTWTWAEVNGVRGYLVKSVLSGYTDRSIFLPAAGCRYDTNLNSVGYYGDYWSSSLDTDLPNSALYIGFDSGGVQWGYGTRFGGRSVRPVCP